MINDESIDELKARAMKSATNIYLDLPKYLDSNDTFIDTELPNLLVNLMDALDYIEYDRSGTTFFDYMVGQAASRAKVNFMQLLEDYRLTKRERYILPFLLNDASISIIAKAADISPSTVKVHKYSIFKKLDVHSMSELKDKVLNYSRDENKNTRSA